MSENNEKKSQSFYDWEQNFKKKQLDSKEKEKFTLEEEDKLFLDEWKKEHLTNKKISDPENE